MTFHRPRPVLRSAAIRAVEAEFADVEPRLMERAGRAVAEAAGRMCPAGRRSILVAAGPGNNGGDGFVAARLLHQAGCAVTVVFVGKTDRLPPDARAAHDTWRAGGGEVLDALPDRPFDLAIDALFGIGLTRAPAGDAARLIGEVGGLGCPVLAVDVPSGLDADTGRVFGAAVRATRTVTFIALKPGLLTLDGPDHCGGIELAELDIPCPATDGELIAPRCFRQYLRPRAANSHKGSYGSLAVIGGAPGMAGAALLAARAGLHLGAGRVHVGMIERLPVDVLQPELMLRTADEALALATTVAIGPGLGRGRAAEDLLRRVIMADLPTVVDADGLNLAADHAVLLRLMARRKAPTVLTPHPAEAARLMGCSTDTVQGDRVAAALRLAAEAGSVVVLKGCGSIVAEPGGRWWINASGNAGLASAGSGDVLTGMIGALLAQGWPAAEAAQAACHLHGAAAERLATDGNGPIGITAGELAGEARKILNRWIADA